MKTVEQLFCAHHSCEQWEFRRYMFWHALYPHARPFAVLLGGRKNGFFAPDFMLIDGVAGATTMARLKDEILEYKNAPENRSWLRRVAKVRVSGTRLLRLARVYLQHDAAPI